MGRLTLQPNSLLQGKAIYVLLPSVHHVCSSDIGCIKFWFESICGRDIKRAMERVELVLSQEEMDRDDLEGRNYPIEIVRGLNLKGKPDFRPAAFAGMTNDATNWEGCGPWKWRPVS
jgi:hypothetical protein